MKNRIEELPKQMTLEEKVSMLAGSDEIWQINADHLAERAGEHPIASGDNVTLPAQSVSLYIFPGSQEKSCVTDTLMMGAVSTLSRGARLTLA